MKKVSQTFWQKAKNQNNIKSEIADKMGFSEQPKIHFQKK